jgi:FtsZ-binding cell division protein ZapB
MSDPTWFDELTKNTTALIASVGGIGAVGLWLRKYFKDMGLTDQARELDVNKITGVDDVITMLRSEISRLAEMNKVLSNEIRDFQSEIVLLRNENIDLRSEIHELNEQIKLLQASASRKREDYQDKK